MRGIIIDNFTHDCATWGSLEGCSMTGGSLESGPLAGDPIKGAVTDGVGNQQREVGDR
jgi:hypothetical protein